MSDDTKVRTRKTVAGAENNPAAPENRPERRAFRTALLGWFDDHKRQLPWRGIDDPYGVWVSEVMLQQTRVQTVIDYFQKWMQEFPTVEDLAKAPTEQVLELWSGLGYYRRARYLHKAANTIVDDYGGRLPKSVSELQKLPGVGPYTAGAIASIAFEQAEALVDGNVMRVISRLYTIEGKPRRSPAKKMIWDRAEELVDPDRPGDFNQALMELGSEICTSNSPRCMICPVKPWCAGFATGDPARFPNARDRPEQQPMRARSCVVYRRGDQGLEFLLNRRDSAGLLGGLWEFPSCERDGKTWPKVDELHRRLETGLGGDWKGSSVDIGRAMGTVTHVFSHRRLKVRVHEVDVDAAGVDVDEAVADDETWRWVDDAALGDVASAALLGKIDGVFRAHR